MPRTSISSTPPGSTKRELFWLHCLAQIGFGHELARWARAFAVRDNPAHQIATGQLQNHVEIEVAPLLRPAHPSEMRALQLTGTFGQKLRTRALPASELMPRSRTSLFFRENTTHRSHGAQVPTFSEQHGVDLSTGIAWTFVRWPTRSTPKHGPVTRQHPWPHATTKERNEDNHTLRPTAMAQSWAAHEQLPKLADLSFDERFSLLVDTEHLARGEGESPAGSPASRRNPAAP